ncbi:MAG: hypothetical protein K1X57_12480 [Gemmataceae bacterium]|nr:hypothetical protein [Gemmataceae bacterium]
MTRKNSFRPTLQRLETRWVPATISLTAGSLNISNPTGALVVETTAVTGQIKVTDGSKVVTLSNVGSQINITGNNLANSISFRANTAGGNKAFPGNLFVDSGNGNDTVDLSGTVSGTVLINTGLGNDLVTATSNDVNVGGLFRFTDTAGTNTFDLNDRNWTLGNNFMLSGVGLFDMGTGNNLTVGGSMFVNATPAPAPGVPMTAQFNGLGVTIAQGLYLTGGTADDVVAFTANTTVGGSVVATLGEGNNTFVYTPTAGAFAGSFNYTGGAGVDVVVLGASSNIAGQASVSLGNGINTFVDTATSQYAGNLNITGGNGTNTAVVTGNLSGDFFNTFGNGDGNTTVFTGVLAGKFNYRVGNGQLTTLTLAPAIAQTVNINATFGFGSSTFNLGPNLTLTGTVRGTGGLYTFNQGTAVLTSNLFFINYP